jgi:hypothetical protein
MTKAVKTKAVKLSKTANVLRSSGISVADLRLRWGKLNDRELAAIKSRHDLVRQIQSKFGLNRMQAQTNVDVWAAGRMFEADEVGARG